MFLKLLSCEVLARELYYCAATSPHVVDIQLLRRGLHNTPDVLRAEIQKQINAAAEGGYNAVCLGYGLCGNSLKDVVARNVPLVLPRAHDCITLYLGSRARYQQEFTANPGTYYYAVDYIERRRPDDSSGLVPLGAANEAQRQELRAEYVAKYGEENADYLMEVMGAWSSHYNRAAYIDMGLGDPGGVEHMARAEAAVKGWTFAKLAGSLVLLRKLVHGEWDDDFLIIQPGGRIVVTYDENVVGCTMAAGEQ